MMTALITFLISESRQICITINEENKVNIYGYKTNDLHVFDEIEVEYVNGDKKILLASDIVRYVVKKFETALKNCLTMGCSWIVLFLLEEWDIFLVKKNIR